MVLDGGDLVGGMEQRDDDLVPAEMAVAEALILLPPALVRLDPTTTPATDQLAVGDSSVNETADGIDGHHLLLRPTDSSGEFAYDDHVIEIVQLDPLASPSAQAAALWQQQQRPAPPMNKTTSNPAADVIPDSSSHPSTSGEAFEPLTTTTTPPTLPTTEAQVTIRPSHNDSISSSNAAQLNSSGPAESSFHSVEILHRLANVSSQLMPNVTNDTLPPDADETEPDLAVKGTWPVTRRIDPAQVLLSMAGNISEELLTPWSPDVISYRGSVVQPSGCDCQCPVTTTTTTDAEDETTTTYVIPTEPPSPNPVTQPIDPVQFSCPTLPATTTTAMSTAAETEATTTATPTTPPTTTKMIPPILILEGEGRRIL